MKLMTLARAVATSHVHSTTGGYVFTGVCLCRERGGTPASGSRWSSSFGSNKMI